MLGNQVEEIKSRLSILEIIQDFVQLKKAGTNYKGLCPFHSEKTGSFMVSPSKQIWHCFGCGVGGDVFEFIKLIENVEFAEALKILADRAGVELKKPTVEQIQVGKKKDSLFEINFQASKYFQKVLWETNAGSEALAYLRKRGLTDQTIKNWQLGFAPDDFHYLENYLAKSFDKKDIEMAGLIIRKDDGTYFDRFHDRVMFTIQNVHGQVVGFTGRLLHDKPNTGKYVNSPETPIYNKSQIIYGLYQGKNAVRKLDQAILVEGNMDVVSCHQAGFAQTVATSGTALTETQLNVLARFTQNLVFAFDSDTAGSNATKRALEMALNAGFNVKIIQLGEAKDPDEMIKRGIGIWAKAVDGACNYVDYFFDLIFRQRNAELVEEKREITKELAPLIFRINDPVTKAHYIRKLSKGVNVAESAIWDIINKLNIPKATRMGAKELKRKSREEILESRLLGLILSLNALKVLDGFEPADFEEGNRQVFINIKKEGSDAGKLKKAHPDLAEKIDLLIFGAETDVKEQDLEAESELTKTSAEFLRTLLKKQMQRLTEQITTAEQKGDKELIKKLSEEYLALSNKVSLT